MNAMTVQYVPLVKDYSLLFMVMVKEYTSVTVIYLEWPVLTWFSIVRIMR